MHPHKVAPQKSKPTAPPPLNHQHGNRGPRRHPPRPQSPEIDLVQPRIRTRSAGSARSDPPCPFLFPFPALFLDRGRSPVAWIEWQCTIASLSKSSSRPKPPLSWSCARSNSRAFLNTSKSKSISLSNFSRSKRRFLPGDSRVGRTKTRRQRLRRFQQRRRT